MSLPLYQRNRKKLWGSGGDLLGRRSLDGGKTWTDCYSPAYNNSEVISDWVHKGPPYRSGGPMLLQRKILTIDQSASLSFYKTGFPSVRYSGKVIPEPLPGEPVLPSYDFAALGSEAISRTLPTNPTASLAQFLAELREAPRMLLQAKRFFAGLVAAHIRPKKEVNIRAALNYASSSKGAGSDYLGLQFGWVPFVNDIVSALKTGRNFDKKVAFLKRNFGKPIRRKRRLRDKTDVTLVKYDVGSPLLVVTQPSMIYGQAYSPESGNGTRQTVDTVTSKVWFEATYRHYSPEVAAINPMPLFRSLYGLNLDPELIYNLIPWTWLIDWFTNAGALLHNALQMAKHHIVISHGYVMCHNRGERKVTCTQGFKNGSSVAYTRIGVSCSATCLFETKQRVPANPYGFGITWDGLSPYQASILAALGITRRSHSSQ